MERSLLIVCWEDKSRILERREKPNASIVKTMILGPLLRIVNVLKKIGNVILVISEGMVLDLVFLRMESQSTTLLQPYATDITLLHKAIERLLVIPVLMVSITILLRFLAQESAR